MLAKFPHRGVVQLDLTLPSVRDMILHWLRKEETVAVFLAPPCGASSLAREIPIEGDDNPPAPLRSVLEPDGIAGISGRDHERVCQANLLQTKQTVHGREPAKLAVLAYNTVG